MSALEIDPCGSTAAAAQAVAWTEQTIELSNGELLSARIHGRRRDDGTTPLVLHFHGGAFVGGSSKSGAPVAQLLAQAGSVVVSIDYPLAPAHPFPAAAEVGHAAALWLHRNRRRLGGADAVVLLAGDEAGGNLAAAVALMARDRQRPPLGGQILLSPMLDPCLGTASLREAEVGMRDCPWARGWKSYLAQVADAGHPYAVPAICMRLAQLAPTLVVTAGDDPMRDEALAFAAKLRDAGVAVEQAVMASGTGWPLGYLQGAAQPDWPQALRDRLQRFIAACRLAPSPKGDSQP